MNGVLEVPRTEWVPGQTVMPVPGVRRIGSLFSGYGGLDMGVQAVLGGELAWVSDIDPGACKILAHHHPAVPNLGDVSAVDWADVEPVDVLTGGFPCQDVSAAGKRAGLHSGSRSGLWAQMVRAIEALRPSLVVAENVRGILSACATSELEPCPRCLGDDSRPHRSVLRAAGRVVGDLAELGYVCRWGGLPASAVGAPHARFREFFLAWPAADPGGVGRVGGAGVLGGGWGAPVGGEAVGDAGDPGRSRAVEDADGAAGGERWVPAPGEAEGWGARPDAGRRVGAPAADSEDDGHADVVTGGPAPSGAGSAGAAADAADTACVGRDEGRSEPAGQFCGAAADADADSFHLRVEPFSVAGSRRQAVVGDAGPDAGPDAAADTDGDGLAGLGRVVDGERDADRRGGAQRAGGAGQPAAPAADASGGGDEDEPLGGAAAGEPQRPVAGPGAGDRPGRAAARVRDVGGAATELAPVAWGAFGPAVRRWEGLTRPATPPTVQDWDAWQRRRDSAIRRRTSGTGMRPVGMRGSVAPLWMPPPHRLSPLFVEWMMGPPLGHVTAVPGLNRAEQLKALGNGVVPQQAAVAVDMLLDSAPAWLRHRLGLVAA